LLGGADVEAKKIQSRYGSSGMLLAARNGLVLRYLTTYRRFLRDRLFGGHAWLHTTMPVSRRLGIKPVLGYIEMHVADHCNLKCCGCSHFSSISPPRFTDPDSADADFARLQELFGKITLVRLMGGEPLLHPKLGKILRSARTRLPTSEIDLVTNGLALAKQPRSFFELLSSAHIGLYLSNYPVPLELSSVRSTCALTGVRLTVPPPIKHFSKVPIIDEGNKDPVAMHRRCRREFYCPFLYEGAVYTCARVALSPILAAKFGRSLPLADGDSIVLEEVGDGYDVLKFLSRPVPWCRFCGYDSSMSFPWSVTTESASEWFPA
jgi:hypothetical protein